MPVTNRNKYSGQISRTISDINNISTAIAKGASFLGSALATYQKSGSSISEQIKQVSTAVSTAVSNTFTAEMKSKAASASTTLQNLSMPNNSTLTALQLGGDSTLMDILASTSNSSTQNNELKYKIFLQFEGNDKNYYDDTLFLSVYRIGVLKFSTFYLMRINLTNVLVEQLKLEKSNNKIIKTKLFIYTIETNASEVKLKNLVLERNFVVAAVVPRTDTVIERGNSVMCDLMLLNPTLFEMNQTYTYNKILNTKTPYEILQDYESHIDQKYGNNFETKHILNNKNDFKYQQVVTQPTKQKVELPNNEKVNYECQYDSSVPLFLQYKYKIDNSFGFYFYDDFNLKSKKEITRYFISFYDKNKFEKFKIETQSDILKQTQYTKSYDFTDFNRMISKDNVVINYKLPNSEYATKKTQKCETTTSSTSVQNKVELSSGDSSRFYQAQRTTETKKQQDQSANYQTIQVPDNKTGATKRVNLLKETIEKKIDKVDEFSTNNCAFDWLQFGIIYAMNENKPNEYLHTPVSIVNVFHRLNNKENILVHMARYMMIKFRSDDVSSENNNKSNPTNTDQNKSQTQLKTPQLKQNTPSITTKIQETTKKTPTTDSTKLLRTSNGEVIDYVHNFGEMDWKEQVYGGAVKKNETGTTATVTGPTSNKPS